MVIYIQPLEACHLQMIRSKGLSHFMRLRSSENFVQSGWLTSALAEMVPFLVDYSTLPMVIVT